MFPVEFGSDPGLGAGELVERDRSGFKVRMSRDNRLGCKTMAKRKLKATEGQKKDRKKSLCNAGGPQWDSEMKSSVCPGLECLLWGGRLRLYQRISFPPFDGERRRVTDVQEPIPQVNQLCFLPEGEALLKLVSFPSYRLSRLPPSEGRRKGRRGRISSYSRTLKTSPAPQEAAQSQPAAKDVEDSPSRSGQ